MGPRTVAEQERIYGYEHVPHVPKAVTVLDREVELKVRQAVGNSIGVLSQAANAAAQLALDRDALGDSASDVRVPSATRIREAIAILEGLAGEWL